MSRPKPTVLLQHSNKTTFKMDEVLAAEGIWAVFYDGKPINLKSSSLVANYPGPKYKKVSFSNPVTSAAFFVRECSIVCRSLNNMLNSDFLSSSSLEPLNLLQS